MNDQKMSFANIVLPHLGDAFGLARWLAGNDTDANDIVQEACLRAFRGLSGYAGTNARGWVLSIVRNTAYTWLGKHRDPRLVTVEDPEQVEAVQAADGLPWETGGGVTPEAALIEKADAARLEAAIAALPAEFRETLVLRDLQGLDYRSIAGITGVPVGTVMSRLARARRRLIDQLGRDE